jgi:F0F1-type ATP synthase membrane subunit b/b'
MAVIIHVPEALRQKLGEDGTKELVALIDQAARGLRENIGENAAERIERRITETKADLEKQMAALKVDLVKWMFAFWVGQAAVTIGLLSFFYNLLR